MSSSVNLNAVREAAREERQRAVVICELCSEAGVPSMAEGFIRAGTTARDVQKTLEALPAASAKPSAGGNGFDLTAIERALTEKRTLQ